ncbi:MAG TPA: alpha/beta hydrolase [Pyrinomonadaceae bacterium]|nr:alpha/beta hydrolase [Pyrinomonadaceae bacterium]
MTEITHSFAQVNGIRLHYAEAGEGDHLVILLHGFPEFWYSWRHQIEELGKSYHVVAPDMRGYNLSDKPERIADYRMDVLVEDVVGLINHFGKDKAIVVGHDWGGAVAWAVAQKHPERVSKVAVLQVPPVDAWRKNMSLRQMMRSWYMFFFQLPAMPEWAIRRKDFAGLNKVFKDSVIRKGSFDDADIEIYKEALRRPGAVKSALNYYRANVLSRLISSGAKGRNGTPKAEGSTSSKIRVPTLFIFAEQDFAILPATVRGVENFIDAPYREVRIADSGHWVQNEAADEVNRALLDFFAA